MASLKSAYDRLGAFFSASAGHLYERQRALIGAGVLQLGEGRGPGSGIQATPESLAVLVVSLLATDSIAAAAERTREILALRVEHDTRRCPLTGRITFGAAMTKLISQPALVRRVKEINVSWTILRADVVYDGHSRTYFSSSKPQHYPVIKLSAAIPGVALREACSIALPDLYGREN